MAERIGIIGSGGHADEVESYTHDEVFFRAVTRDFINERATIDVETPPFDLINMPVHIAVGAPALRKWLKELWPGNTYSTIVADTAYIDRSAEVQEGCMIAPQSVITTNVKLGKHAIVNVAASVQHDSKIGDYTTISPGVRVGGSVSVGEGVFLGIGSAVKNNVRIAPGAVLGAGAVLINNADVENGVYVGVPARLVRVNEGWLNEV